MDIRFRENNQDVEKVEAERVNPTSRLVDEPSGKI